MRTICVNRSQISKKIILKNFLSNAILVQKFQKNYYTFVYIFSTLYKLMLHRNIFLHLLLVFLSGGLFLKSQYIQIIYNLSLAN